MRRSRTPVSHRGPRSPSSRESFWVFQAISACLYDDFFSAMHGVGVPFGHRPGRAHAQAVVTACRKASARSSWTTRPAVATYDGKTLPGLVNYSQKRAALGFDAELYAANGISVEEINAIRNVVSRIDYKQCVNGCDMQVAATMSPSTGAARWIFAARGRITWRRPRRWAGQPRHRPAARDGYRSANVMAIPGWVCQGAALARKLVWRSQPHAGPQHQQPGAVVVLPAKNFRHLCAGKQNSIDYASGLGQHRADPSFDRFVTIVARTICAISATPALVLYATAEGNHEFYRNGRLVEAAGHAGPQRGQLSGPAGGLHPLEIRLVDRNGNVSTAKRGHQQLNFARPEFWHVTVGQEMNTGENLVQASVSRN